MRRWMPFVLLLLAGSACHSPEEKCACAATAGLFVNAESVEVEAFEFGGPACTAPQVTSGYVTDAGLVPKAQFVPNAQRYTIMPNAEGDCSVTVVLADGTRLEKTVAFHRGAEDDCCGAGSFFADAGYWELSPGSPPDAAPD